MINLLNLTRLRLLSGRGNPGLGKVSLASALAEKTTASFQWSAEDARLRPWLPGINEELAITDDGGITVPNFLADGYLSAIYKTAPERVWPLDTGFDEPDAVAVTRRVLVDPNDERFPINADTDIVAGTAGAYNAVLRGEVSVTAAGADAGDIAFTGSLPWGAATWTNVRADVSAARLIFRPSTVPVNGSRVYVIRVNADGSAGGWTAFNRDQLVGPVGAGDYYWPITNLTAFRAAFSDGAAFVLLLTLPAVSGFRRDLRQVVSTQEQHEITRSSLLPPATAIGTANSNFLIDSLPARGTADFSAAGWVRLAAAQINAGVPIIRQSDGTSSSASVGWWLQRTAGGGGRWCVVLSTAAGSATSVVLNALQSVAPVTADTWHHLAVVRQGANLTLYQDGAQVATRTGGDVDLDDDNLLTLGGEAALDDWAIWNRALTAAEVAGFYAARNGLTALDTSALLDASQPRAIAQLDPPSGAAMLGNADLPHGGSVNLAIARTVADFGRRQAGTDYSWSQWLHLHTFPLDRLDVRLADNDDAVPADGSAGSPVYARDRTVEFGPLTRGMFYIERATRRFVRLPAGGTQSPGQPGATAVGTLPAGMSDVNAMAQHSDGNLYAASGAELWIVDADNPSASRRVGTIGTQPETYAPVGMVSVGERLYGVTVGRQLIDIDVATPASTGVVGTFGSNSTRPTGLLSDGSRVFLLDVGAVSRGNLILVDTANPAASTDYAITRLNALSFPSAATYRDGFVWVFNSRTVAQGAGTSELYQINLSARTIARSFFLPSGSPDIRALASFDEADCETETDIAVSGGGTITSLTISRSGAASMTFTGTLVLPNRRIVILREDGSEVLTGVYTLDLSSAMRTSGTATWAAATVDGAAFHSSVEAEDEGWSVLVVDTDTDGFDAATWIWQRPSRIPQPIYRLAAEAGRPEIVVEGVPSGTGAPVNLISGAVRVANDTPLRFRYRGPAVNRTNYFGPMAQPAIALTESGEVINTDGRKWAVSAAGVLQNMICIDFQDDNARLDFNAAMVVRCGDLTLAANLTRRAGDDLLEGPVPNAYARVTPQLDRGHDVEVLIVRRDAAGLNTETWTWGAPESVAVRVRLRGAAEQDAVEVSVPWPHDGEPHLCGWSLTRGALTLSVGGAGAVTVPTRLPAPLFGADPPTTGSDQAVHGLQVAIAPHGAGTEGGVSGQALVESGTHGYSRNTGTSLFYIHRFIFSYTASGSPPEYRLAVAISGSPGAIYSSVPTADVEGLTLLFRLWQSGVAVPVSVVFAAADRQTGGQEPFVIAVPASDLPTGFDNQRPPDAVDVAIVDDDHADYLAATGEIVGVGPDVYDADFSIERDLVSQFSTAAQTAGGLDSPLRLWHSEQRAMTREIATFGVIWTRENLTGTVSTFGIPPAAKVPTTSTPSLRGGTKGQAQELEGGETLVAVGGGITFPDGSRVAISRLSFFRRSTEYIRLTMAQALPSGTDYTLVMLDGFRVAHQVPFSDATGRADGDLYEYRWARPAGFPDYGGGIVWDVSVFDRAASDWATGGGASPPNYNIAGFTFPTTYNITLLAIHDDASTSEWNAAPGPHLQLRLDFGLVLPGAVLGNYRLFVRVPSSPEQVFQFPLAAPDFTNEAPRFLRAYYWNISAQQQDAFFQARRLYGNQPWQVTLQDVGSASYRSSDFRILSAETPLTAPTVGGADVGSATMMAEWRREVTTAEFARLSSLSTVGRWFTGRVKQESRKPVIGAVTTQAESLAADLDDRLIKAPVEIAAGTSARGGVTRILNARGVRGAQVTATNNLPLVTQGLPITADTLDDDVAGVLLQAIAVDADFVSAALDRIASDTGIDGFWFIDRSRRLRMRRGSSVEHRADLSMRQVVGQITTSSNREQLRTAMTVQGGPPSDGVIADDFEGDGEQRTWDLSNPVTSVNGVRVVRSAGGEARPATFSTVPDDGAEWYIDAENDTITQSTGFPPLAVGGVVQVSYASNHPIRVTEYDADAIARFRQIDRVHEDKTLISVEEVRAMARALLRRNSDITHAASFVLDLGAAQFIEPGHGIRITGSVQVDGSIVRLVRSVRRSLNLQEPGPTRWKTSIECIGADRQIGQRYSGRIPLTKKQEARSVVRLHVSTRSASRAAGTIGVLTAASAPWALGGDPGTWESYADWTNGLSSWPFPVDGRRTRQQPHELQVSGKVQAEGTTMEVRLTQNGVPVPRSTVRIDSAEMETVVLRGVVLEPRVLTLRFQVRTLGTAGGRLARVHMVPEQEVLRDA